MVLIFSGLLLAEMISPKLGARLRAITPLLLLAGGVFLMIRSDTDAWPLSNQRPITDKEVLMHKTYAVLMLAFGIQGLRGRKRRRRTSLRAWRNGARRRRGAVAARARRKPGRSHRVRGLARPIRRRGASVTDA